MVPGKFWTESEDLKRRVPRVEDGGETSRVRQATVP